MRRRTGSRWMRARGGAGVALAACAAGLAAPGMARAACGDPGSVELVSPPDGAIVAGDPLFTWTTECATSYVQFSTDDDFHSDVVTMPESEFAKFRFPGSEWQAWRAGEWSRGVYWRAVIELIGPHGNPTGFATEPRHVLTYPDADGDGYGGDLGGDCDNHDPDVRPLAREVCGDGLDNDCDGYADMPCGVAGVTAFEAVETFIESSDWSGYGTRVAGVGDVNGDGHDDFALGEYSYGSAGQVLVFFGPVGAGSFTAADADATLTADTASYAGWSLAGAGDVDGDGYDDMLIGSPYSFGNCGAVSLVHGPLTAGSYVLEDAAQVLRSGTADAHAGYSVSGAGDVNGDGIGDFLVGAHTVNGGDGRVYLVRGPVPPSASVLDTVAAATITGDAGSDARVGWSVAGLGDVDGDGYGDVLVGAPDLANRGAAGLFLGPIGAGDHAFSTAHALFIADGDQDNVGASVGRAGDLDGDGLADVIVGMDVYDATAGGGTAIWYGPVAAGSHTIPSADSLVLSDVDEAYSYVWVNAGAGDVDGDARGDLVIGDRTYYAPALDGSRVWVVHGPPALGTSMVSDAVATFIGFEIGYQGGVVASAGDQDGDGRDDVLFSGHGQTKGAAWLVHSGW